MSLLVFLNLNLLALDESVWASDFGCVNFCPTNCPLLTLTVVCGRGGKIFVAIIFYKMLTDSFLDNTNFVRAIGLKLAFVMANNNNLQFYHSGYTIDDPQQGQTGEQAYYQQQAVPPPRGYEPAGYSSYGVEQMDVSSSAAAGDGIFGTMGQMDNSQQPIYEYGQGSGFEDEPPLLEGTV